MLVAGTKDGRGADGEKGIEQAAGSRGGGDDVVGTFEIGMRGGVESHVAHVAATELEIGDGGSVFGV